MSPPEQTQDPRIVSLPASEIRRRFVEFFEERGHTPVPSAGLVPAGDQTLLFTNSGMVQFKEVFTGAETRSYTRAVDYQRCLRVAGKHNDFEEVGRTPRHHTLFEMLGNWSFGDYFKREAIHWAWDFLTKDLGIPGDRLAATTYKDDELAWEVWRDEIGLPPERMARWGDVDNGDDKNFWRMADTGPCGPCSEIHFDRGPEFSEGPHCTPDHDEHCPRWLEIWNLVFMEFDQRADGRVPLPFTSVDTGMGLERLASVLQQVPTNYDTDLFTPIHARMRELIGHDPESFENERFSYQVIADHSRAVTFLIGDDVLPSNEGRGYVLRRILRRAVRHGRLLGRREPFMAEAAATVIEVMGEAYPHLVERREEILAAIAREEAQFARTLDAGTSQLEAALRELTDEPRVVGRRPEDLPAGAPDVAGDLAFRLHDTYGFPIDLTIELAAEYGVGVDRAGFDRALAEQRDRSRSGTKAQLSKTAGLASLYGAIHARASDSEFLGYETTTAEGRIVGIIRDGLEFDELTGHGEAEVILDRTPFYAEGGGQVGDLGVLREAGGGSELFSVTDTQRPLGGLIVHRGTLHGRLRVGETVSAEVDADRRAHTMRNHTGTHLLHRALRNVVGDRARQAGSLVTPDHLRFDFPLERGLTTEGLRAIEDEVRRIIRDDRPVSIAFMPMADAIAGGADAFFDEKYGETVRTIRVQDYSFELCGGTHCRASGQIGGFVITGERSIGSGMRRIEALTGAGADAHLRERTTLLEAAATAVGARSLEDTPDRIAALQDELREAKRRLKAGGGAGIPKPAALVADATEVRPGVRLVAAALPYESMDTLKAAARDVSLALGSGVVALALDADEPQLFVTVSDDLAATGISAGDLVTAAMPAIEGRGGGRPAMAQGRGTRRDGLPEALAALTTRLGNGGLMAFWRRIWQRDGDQALAACTALDVGTEFAKALVFDIDPDGHGTVRGVGRKRQGLSHMQSGTVADIAAVVDNCAVALQEAEEMAGFRPTQVVIGIAGELVKGFTTTHSQERKKPDQPITENELQKLIDVVQREALHEAERAITWETGLPHVDVRLVHAAVTGASIDGYALTNPVGFQGRHVKIGIFNAFAPLVHLGALQSVASQLDLELLEIVAEPYAVARVLGSEQIRQAGALFVDVGGGTTDVALVRHGGIEGTRMFALGGRAFTKSIADRMDLPFPRAESLKVDYARGLGAEQRDTVSSIISDDVRVWAAGVELVMEELSGGDLLPGRIFLCGGGSRLPEIRAALEAEAFWGHLPFARPPEVTVMSPDQIDTISDATSLLVDQQDVTPLGLAYQAIELQTSEDALDVALRRVLRAMKV